MKYNRIILVFCLIISIIALVLGSIGVHRTMKGSLKQSDITGIWEGKVKTITEFGKNTEQFIRLELKCDSNGFVTGTKEFTHYHGTQHSHDENISGITDFLSAVRMVENDYTGTIDLDFSDNRKCTMTNRSHRPSFICTQGPLEKVDRSLPNEI